VINAIRNPSLNFAAIKMFNMKVVAYSTKFFEKEYLAKANQKKHDITLISNELTKETCFYAEGKKAVLVFTNDDVSANIINTLADMGIRYIATRSTGMDHIDLVAAAKHNIQIANVPKYSPESIAEHAVALAMNLSRHLNIADKNAHAFDFRLDGLTGFSFKGKTVGLIGLGNSGRATAEIFHGMGCHVIGYDKDCPMDSETITRVHLPELFAQSDIISLHLPLTPETKYMINAASIALMKRGAMLINTARGGLINTADLLQAMNDGQIGYLGLDVYEYEQSLFFEDHSGDSEKDIYLEKLLSYPNVMITPHQAFLTKEALSEIASQTIKTLDNWQKMEELN